MAKISLITFINKKFVEVHYIVVITKIYFQLMLKSNK